MSKPYKIDDPGCCVLTLACWLAILTLVVLGVLAVVWPLACAVIR